MVYFIRGNYSAGFLNSAAAVHIAAKRKYNTHIYNIGDIMELIIIPIIIIAVLAIIILTAKVKSAENDAEIRRAGRRGEIAAANIIKSVLREDDLLFTNVKISFEDKPAELDNLIINSFGVFIIEVKDYNGRLYGGENDYEWIKYKDDGYGNTFEKKVKNPIKQVKRQVYVLSKYLNYRGERVWIDGYAFLVHGNSPVNSKYMLSGIDDIDRAIHTPGKKRLTKQQVNSIAKLIQV